MSGDPRFDPPCGAVIGWRDGAVTRATGIRYATARRFAPPRTVTDRAEPIDARGWSPKSPQPADPIADTMFGAELRDLAVDEECQYLSITMRAAKSTGPLPVMVWIHGGGFVTGAGDFEVMDPASLVTEQNVVVVNVTYRLGLFGFIETELGPTANLGLLDLVEAFRWVRRNIGAFGGDPENITAFGQSAGAAAIADLMATEGASDLFDRAILQSAPLGITRGRDRMNRELAARARSLRPETPIQDVLDVQAGYIDAAGSFGFMGGMPIAPQYGYAPLPPQEELDAALDRVAPDIDVLIGHTSEEARLFLTALPGLQGWLRVPALGDILQRIVVGFATRSVYSRAARRFARRHRRAGGRTSSYVLSWAAPGNPIGSPHTIDLPLLLGNERAWAHASLIAGARWSDVEADGRALRAVWADFARGEKLESSRNTRFLRIRS